MRKEWIGKTLLRSNRKLEQLWQLSRNRLHELARRSGGMLAFLTIGAR